MKPPAPHKIFPGSFTAPDPLAGSLTDPTGGEPLSIPYISWLSPYAYCASDPINFTDPTGMFGICIVDKENKNITVVANYHVITQNPQSKVPLSFAAYDASDITEMNEYSSFLNGLGLTIESGEYKDYTVTFELTFIDAGGPEHNESFRDDVRDGFIIGNSFKRMSKEIAPKIFNFKEEYDDHGNFKVTGGLHEGGQITMNAPYDDKMNRIHEIFHSFGLKDEMKRGIMNYPPGIR